MVRLASLFTSTILFAGFTHGLAQQPAPDAASPAPSALVTPALGAVGQSGSSIDLNKWKGSSAVRSDVDANITSMQKDLQKTLPELVSASDAAPDSAAAAMPMLLNIDALYSVLLRVTIASRTGAPKDQNAQLEKATLALDNARRELGERIVAIIAANEKKVSTLQATVQQQAAALQAAQAPPPPPPTSPTKVIPKKKPTPAAKPAPARPAQQ